MEEALLEGRCPFHGVLSDRLEDTSAMRPQGGLRVSELNSVDGYRSIMPSVSLTARTMPAGSAQADKMPRPRKEQLWMVSPSVQ